MGIARGTRMARCRRGHAFAGGNLYVEPATGYQRCRICMGTVSRKTWRKKCRDANAAKTHCKKGHALADNTYVKKNGFRSCAACEARSKGRPSVAERRAFFVNLCESRHPGIQLEKGKGRRCIHCSNLTYRARFQVTERIIAGEPIEQFLASAKEHGFDMSSYADKTRSWIENIKETDPWQYAKRRLTTAHRKIRSLQNHRLQSVWPWPIEESKPAKTSRR